MSCPPNRMPKYPHDRYIETKYLYIDSESRDSGDYPNPAEFSISLKDTSFQSSRTIQNTLHVAIELKRLTVPGSEIPAGTKELFVHIGSQNDKHTKMITTNNRDVNDAIFVIPINKVAIDGFYHLLDCGMTQRIRFKLDDYINFRVATRDGVTLPISDNIVSPDPTLQITALIEIAPYSTTVH